MAEETQNINKLVTKENLAEFATGIDTKHKQHVDDISKELEINSDFRSAIASAQAYSIRNKSMIIFDDKVSDNLSYNVIPNYSDENNKIQGKCAININKTLDNIGTNDMLSISLKYKLGGEYNIYKTCFKVALGTTEIICSKLFRLINNNTIIFRMYANQKINSDFTTTEDIHYCAIEIAFALNISVETIAEIRDSLELYVDICSLNTLTLDNTEQYTPSSDYHPATKKYVDDSIKGVVFSSPFISTDWVLNPDTTFYELSVNHNLNSSNLSVFSRNTVDNYDMFVDYEIVDENNIKIISDEACDCSVKIHAY